MAKTDMTSTNDEREALRQAYIAGATAVHKYWAANPGEPPQNDPEFGEAASDYAASLPAPAPGQDAVADRDAMIDAARRAITDRYYAGGKVRQMTAVKPRELAELVLDAALPLLFAPPPPEQCANIAQKSKEGGVAAFAASDAACVYFPGADQKPERAAFQRGAEYASRGPEGEAVRLLRAFHAADDARNDCPECENEGPWEHCGPCSDRLGEVINNQLLFLAALNPTTTEGGERLPADSR